MGERNKIDPEIVKAYEKTGAFWLPVGNAERQEGFVAGWQARAERERRLASAEDIHALADRLHESGLHKASVHARSLAHELERQSSETP